MISPNLDILASPLLFKLDILRLHKINPIQRIQQGERAALVFNISNKTVSQTKIRNSKFHIQGNGLYMDFKITKVEISILTNSGFIL